MDVIKLLDPNWDLEQTKGYKKKPWSASLLRVTSGLQPGNADWQRAALQSKNTPFPVMPRTGEIHPVPTLRFEA